VPPNALAQMLGHVQHPLEQRPFVRPAIGEAVREVVSPFRGQRDQRQVRRGPLAADRPHSYENPANSEARYHDLMIYER
jgi:hypothetical protein